MIAYAIIGKSYCGKGYFIEHFAPLIKAQVFHYGDIIRDSENKNNLCVDDNIISNITRNCINYSIINGYNNVIFDNPLKNIEQAKAFFEEISSCNQITDLNIIKITDKRNNVDITSRGRSDDINIKVKQELWDKQYENLDKEIKSWLLLDNNKLNVQYISINNTDNGFLWKMDS